MKLLTRLSLLLMFCLGGPGSAWADPPDPVGAWTVDVKDSMRPRAMVLTRKGESLQARFGFLEPGAKLGLASVSIDPSGTLTLRTGAESVVVMTPVDAASMRGTFTPRDGKLSRATAAKSTPEAIAAILGTGRTAVAAGVGQAQTGPAEAEAPAGMPVASEVHFIWMGGNDCPPCVHWRATELPKLRLLPEFQRIHFSYVVKNIQSAVPPKFFLPSEVQPFKEVLDVAGAGTPGSPQASVVVDGKVHDYFWGVRSAEDIEAMLKSIRTGAKYPFVRCVKMSAESRKCEARS